MRRVGRCLVPAEETSVPKHLTSCILWRDFYPTVIVLDERYHIGKACRRDKAVNSHQYMGKRKIFSFPNFTTTIRINNAKNGVRSSNFQKTSPHGPRNSPRLGKQV